MEENFSYRHVVNSSILSSFYHPFYHQAAVVMCLNAKGLKNMSCLVLVTFHI